MSLADAVEPVDTGACILARVAPELVATAVPAIRPSVSRRRATTEDRWGILCNAPPSPSWSS